MKTTRYKKVYIEITNVCNLSCAFCLKTNRKPAFIEPSDFEYILNQVKPYTNHIYLHVKGEPLLHPQLSLLLDIAHKYLLRVHIITNGTLIEKQADMLLSKPALHKINFSLHSFEQNKTEEQNNNSYLEKILSFCHKAHIQGNTIISLRLWNLKSNQAKTNLNSHNNSIIQQIAHAFSITLPQIENSQAGNGIKLAHKTYLNFDGEFVWPFLSDNFESTSGFCKALRDQVAILVDGTVVPCCLDGEGVISLGNIHNQAFSEIIDSNRANSIYAGFSQNKAVELLCKKCRYKERFEEKK